MSGKTTRQRIEDILRERPEIRPSDIRNALSNYKISLELNEIITEIEEIHKSIDEDVLVEPPRCKDCGYDDYDNLANIPSSCPDCNSEWIREPRFTINDSRNSRI